MSSGVSGSTDSAMPVHRGPGVDEAPGLWQVLMIISSFALPRIFNFIAFIFLHLFVLLCLPPPLPPPPVPSSPSSSHPLCFPPPCPACWGHWGHTWGQASMVLTLLGLQEKGITRWPPEGRPNCKFWAMSDAPVPCEGDGTLPRWAAVSSVPGTLCRSQSPCRGVWSCRWCWWAGRGRQWGLAQERCLRGLWRKCHTTSQSCFALQIIKQ